MSVDHGRLKVLVTEQFLDDSDIVSRFQKLRGKTVSLMPSSA